GFHLQGPGDSPEDIGDRQRRRRVGTACAKDSLFGGGPGFCPARIRRPGNPPNKPRKTELPEETRISGRSQPSLRLLRSVLAALLVLSVPASMAAASQAARQATTLNVGISTAKPGDPVDIPLTLSGTETPRLSSITVEISFPKATLRFVRASAGLAGEMAEASVQGTVRDAPDVSGLSLLTVTITAKQPIKLGILAYLQFRVATDTPKGMVQLRDQSLEGKSLDGGPLTLAKGRDGQVEVFDRNEQIPLIGCFFFTH
ncbi:MAG: cohesin domain-containing protein, partial [Terriglobia bacterium]